MRLTVLILLALTYSPNLVLATDYSHRHKKVFFPDRLNLPTHVEKIDDLYFIVDCYNNRVIYSDNIETPIPQWKRFGEDVPMSWPHSIASDGEYYLVDDSYAHRVLVFKKSGNNFKFHSSFDDIAKTPHRVIYDNKSDAFYVHGAWSQSITKIKMIDGVLKKLYTKQMPFMKGTYSRSVHIIDNLMYFISGPHKIHAVNYLDDSYEIKNTFPIPSGFESMNDLIKVGNAYYLTASKGHDKNHKIVRCESLLLPESCTSLYSDFDLKGNPYYFSEFDEHIFMTEIGRANDILKLKISGNSLEKIGYLYRN
jgi:hypothetical protein